MTEPNPVSQEAIPGFIPYEGKEPCKQLVVLLHGFQLGPKNLGLIQRFITARTPVKDFFVPRLPLSLFSFANPVEVVRGLLDSVDRICEAKGEGGYEQVTLIGHCFGSLLARKLYLYAHGENSDAPFEVDVNPRPKAADCSCRPPENSHAPSGARAGVAKARAWVDKVDRIILLAGMNRGWSISHHLSIRHAVLWTVGSWIGRALSLVRRREPAIMTIHRGASFITQLRIQWLSMIRHAKKNKIKLAPTIQILGSVDDMVSPDDNVDLVSGDEFVYLDVPFTGHYDVIELDDTSAGVERKKILGKALKNSPEDLKKDSLQPNDYQLHRNEEVEHVIFVIHGIRDEGFWTHKIARKVMTLWRQPGQKPRFASITSSYGYYAMLPFLLLAQRTEKVQWLMDQYVEALARYPNATFYYVGHSNGTYLLARALRENPACHFKRVVFAGSVVRTDFEWKHFQAVSTPRSENAPPQVGSVLNYVATQDWVVAFFPKALELLRLQDLGSAGHDGFEDLQTLHAVPDQPQQNGSEKMSGQVRYVRGGHGAALGEENWEDIAAFITTGKFPEAAEDRFCEKRSWVVSTIGRVAPLVWLALLILIGSIGFGIFYAVGNTFWCGVLVMSYIVLLYKFLTSF